MTLLVDLRRSSQTFGFWVCEILSSENKKQLWIPPGFAHGFMVLSDSAELIYKCTEYYHPEDEHCLLWNDHSLAITWPNLDLEPLLSKKDMNADSEEAKGIYLKRDRILLAGARGQLGETLANLHAVASESKIRVNTIRLRRHEPYK